MRERLPRPEQRRTAADDDVHPRTRRRAAGVAVRHTQSEACSIRPESTAANPSGPPGFAGRARTPYHPTRRTPSSAPGRGTASRRTAAFELGCPGSCSIALRLEATTEALTVL